MGGKRFDKVCIGDKWYNYSRISRAQHVDDPTVKPAYITFWQEVIGMQIICCDDTVLYTRKSRSTKTITEGELI